MVPAIERHTSLINDPSSLKSVEVGGERLSWCAKSVALNTDGILSAANTRKNGGKDVLMRSKSVN